MIDYLIVYDQSRTNMTGRSHIIIIIIINIIIIYIYLFFFKNISIRYI